jgi:hypothetical protein
LKRNPRIGAGTTVTTLKNTDNFMMSMQEEERCEYAVLALSVDNKQQIKHNQPTTVTAE